MLTAGEKLAQSQALYKRNYEERIRKYREWIEPGNHLFLHVDERTEKEGLYMLYITTMVPYLGETVQTETYVNPYRSVHIIYINRVSLTPEQLPVKTLQESILPEATTGLSVTTVTSDEANILL